ncbi:hypothetical protein [Pseudomonas sp.]|uniref:hypothetical protein n=1 Tax=Pseudomonas sp. TaxID=306 RepID=UPI00258AA0F3|nr:hypothetical protein [Pseudomonas sp.]
MNNKTKQALELALDALIFAYYEDEDYNDDCQQKVNEARQAIREALAEQPAPASKPWVGMTDEEKLSLAIQGNSSDVLLAELVEKWLKEKNT